MHILIILVKLLSFILLVALSISLLSLTLLSMHPLWSDWHAVPQALGVRRMGRAARRLAEQYCLAGSGQERRVTIPMQRSGAKLGGLGGTPSGGRGKGVGPLARRRTADG